MDNMVLNSGISDVKDTIEMIESSVMCLVVRCFLVDLLEYWGGLANVESVCNAVRSSLPWPCSLLAENKLTSPCLNTR